MATLREYFDTDPKNLTVHKDWIIGSSKNGKVFTTIVAKIAYDFEANAKYWYIYIPENPDLSACLHALSISSEFILCQLGSEGDGTSVLMNHRGYTEEWRSDTLLFTGRVILYLDFEISTDNRISLQKEFSDLGLNVSIRDREYARVCSENEKPLAFISHDSRDKDQIVRELAHELVKQMCPVWYDEYSLQVGDSLRENIETGLKKAKKCILILSPNFLSNEGWGKVEFNSIYTREIIENKNVMLPIWHEVSKQDVYEYSPRLADIVALTSTLGPVELAKKLSNSIKDA